MEAQDSRTSSRSRLAVRLTGALLVGLLLVSQSAAQDTALSVAEHRAKDTAATDPAQQASRGYGLQVRDGLPLGLGPRFRAEFEAGRVEFVPALGASAPKNQPLSFELDEIRLGDMLVHTADPTTPASLADGLVVYARGDSILERYEVSSAGVLQSFLFDELPAGSGDLVVRGRLHTDLPTPTVDVDGGLRFEERGVGGVKIGAVTGIDAEGNSVAGTLRYVDDAVELVLPAAFVQGAAFPLLLDPLIESIISVNDFGTNDVNASVCTTSGSYFIVWERVFSEEDHDIMIQRLGSNGQLDGDPAVVADFGINTDPVVAEVAAPDRVLVAWVHAHPVAPTFTKIQMASVRHWDRDVSPLTFPDLAAGTQSQVCIGGDQSGTDDEAFLVWREEGVGVVGSTVTVPDDATPFPTGAPFVIAADNGVWEPTAPDISESVGYTEPFLVVWERRSSNSGYGEIWGRLYSRDGLPLVGGTLISNELTGTRSSHNPSCDGNGETFLVAWEREEHFDSGPMDIVCKSIVYRNGLDVPMEHEFVANNPEDGETRPRVTVAGTVGVIGWINRFLWIDGLFVTFSNSVFAKSVDLYTGKSFGMHEVAHGPEQIDSFDLVSRTWTEGSVIDTSLFVWAEDAGGGGNVNARVFDGAGSQTYYTGSCGQSGLHSVQNPAAGNTEFAIHLRGATPDSLAVLVLSGSQAPIECGPCELTPSVEAVYYATTDANGDARIDIPLGLELAGVEFYSQWAVFASGGACTLVDLNLSRALKTTIGTQP